MLITDSTRQQPSSLSFGIRPGSFLALGAILITSYNKFQNIYYFLIFQHILIKGILLSTFCKKISSINAKAFQQFRRPYSKLVYAGAIVLGGVGENVVGKKMYLTDVIGN
jgi:hypothetical protein